MMNKKLIFTSILIVIIAVVIAGFVFYFGKNGQSDSLVFDGERAFRDVAYQVSLGPRTPASQAHAQVSQWIQTELNKSGWNVEIQQATGMGQPLVNIIGRRENQNKTDIPWIILGAHYDTRIFADRDPNPELRTQPVPGANDGASGVAVLLELARVLPRDLPINIWLVFFDGEDNGHIASWDWILGSREFVKELVNKPDEVVIVDMVGDSDLNIYMEKNSDPMISKNIWDVAEELGFKSQFIPLQKHRILDDHVPFLESGIPAVDIIDIDYPPWHTTTDTIDKISSESLAIVGKTLHRWLIQQTDGAGSSSP